MARILVVDDHAPVRLALVRLLETEGHEVDQAADGMQALARFIAHPSDLVLMEVCIPQMNGLETCRQLRTRSRVPILLLSANRDPSIQEQAQACGASTLLSKPLECRQLMAWVNGTHSGQAPQAVYALPEII